LWPTPDFLSGDLPGPCQGTLLIGKLSFQLFIHQLVKNFAHIRASLNSNLLQVVTRDQGLWLDFLLRKFRLFGD